MVQICLNEQWRFVCDDGWDENAIEVFCNNPYSKGEECKDKKLCLCGEDTPCALALSSSFKWHSTSLTVGRSKATTRN